MSLAGNPRFAPAAPATPPGEADPFAAPGRAPTPAAPPAPAGAEVGELRVGMLVETAQGPGIVLEVVQPDAPDPVDGHQNYPVGGVRIGYFAAAPHLPVPLHSLGVTVL